MKLSYAWYLFALFLSFSSVGRAEEIKDAGHGRTVHVAPPGAKIETAPGEEVLAGLGYLRNALRDDGSITEVVIHDGEYVGGCSIHVPKGVDPEKNRLLIRAAAGARPVFVGSVPIEGAEPVAGTPGVWSIPYKLVGSDMPKLWDPGTRVRYRYVADLVAVTFFPASFTVQAGRLYVHPENGRSPADLRRNHEYLDYGLFVARPHVTVRGLSFRDYLARDKWSTAIQLRADYVTVEDCSASNCSLGFTIVENHGVVRRCRAEDCGGGVYVGGEEATVEDCRLFKRRDAFMVPMYAQDDAGIQFYYPAKGGVIRGNLCVGFGGGIFIKAYSAPYLIEHNTIDGAGQGRGFGATKWREGERFRYNIIVNSARELDHLPPLKEGETRDIDFNCYWSSTRKDLKPIGANDVVADPKFVWPALGDYRLANDSPALPLADAAGPAGAFPAIGEEVVAFGDPREWHVSETGQDGLDGTADSPVRTIQFAVDPAKPGDTIIVHPGIYPEPVVITRGGTADRPLVIRAAEKWKAILDSNREAAVMVSIRDASHVILRDLEIRWYGKIAIKIERSPQVTVEGCRIWNAPWGGTWPTGRGIEGYRSPELTVQRCVLFRQEHGVWLHSCPKSILIYNTAAANMYTGALLLHSEACVIRNNSFAHQGSDAIAIQLNKGQADRLKDFECDYNNYGLSVRQAPDGVEFETVVPREKDAFLDIGAKAIVRYNEHAGQMKRFLTMKEWREFSGLDTHTIFADPRYLDAQNRDFQLEPGSTNIGAGEDGATIGALGVGAVNDE